MKKIYLLFCAAAGACFMTGCTPGPQDAAQDYLDAIIRGELSKANALSVSELHECNKEYVRKFTESTEISDKLARIALIRTSKELSDAIVVADGDYAVVYTQDGKNEILKLKKVNGEWKCFSWNK